MNAAPGFLLHYVHMPQKSESYLEIASSVVESSPGNLSCPNLRIRRPLDKRFKSVTFKAHQIFGFTRSLRHVACRARACHGKMFEPLKCWPKRNFKYLQASDLSNRCRVSLVCTCRLEFCNKKTYTYSEFLVILNQETRQREFLLT